MRAIAAELARRGQGAATIEKVLGANFQRVIAEIWRTA
jgi:microsomal dipeptidase-like Zn-dependent dipeptidase